MRSSCATSISGVPHTMRSTSRQSTKGSTLVPMRRRSPPRTASTCLALSLRRKATQASRYSSLSLKATGMRDPPRRSSAAPPHDADTVHTLPSSAQAAGSDTARQRDTSPHHPSSAATRSAQLASCPSSGFHTSGERSSSSADPCLIAAAMSRPRKHSMSRSSLSRRSGFSSHLSMPAPTPKRWLGVGMSSRRPPAAGLCSSAHISRTESR
mmetsp:Transcript_56710/g.149421  ORF Transcript_56710/g.149421 Transcript_56710/m.149421 type:complete len:211 (-) Transcript_56710:172-804(-)